MHIFIVSSRHRKWYVVCRKALRLAASNLGQSQAYKQPRHNLSDPTSLHKDCDFSLDLKVLTAANLSASQDLASSSEVSELEIARSSLLGKFWRQSSQEQQKQPQDLILNGTLQSINCGLELQINATTTHVEVYEAKAVNYTFMVTALTFIQVRVTRNLRGTETCCCPQNQFVSSWHVLLLPHAMGLSCLEPLPRNIPKNFNHIADFVAFAAKLIAQGSSHIRLSLLQVMASAFEVLLTHLFTWF